MLDRTEHVRESRDQMIYRGAEFSRAEIDIAINELMERAKLLQANLKTLNETFTARHMTEIKMSCENIASVAGDAKRTSSQIEALSANLAGVFLSHLNRKPRVGA